MSDIICVTNRALCRGDFLERLKEIAECGVKAIILREKDMTSQEYEELAKEVLKLCEGENIPCILHSFIDTAIRLNAKKIHLSMDALRETSQVEREKFELIGASVHSLEEALKAERLGCGYVIAGHIFNTECKPGLAPRGVDFLREICSALTIPVYAIGGVNLKNISKVRECRAAGACIMSGLMTCEDVGAYLAALRAKEK